MILSDDQSNNMLIDYPIFLETYLHPDCCGSGTGFFFHDEEGNEWLITARHNLYQSPTHIIKFPANHSYYETIVSKLIINFMNQRGYGRWVLYKDEFLDCGRISDNKDLDILIAINLTKARKSRRDMIYHPINPFFTKENLSDESCYSLGNCVIVVGFPSEHISSSRLLR